MAFDGKTVAVTGVGGFIGRRVAERLIERGTRVRGLEQSRDAARLARDAGVEVVEGDVCDPAATEALCAGAGLVIHTAAVVREDGPRALYDRVNVGGTERVL